MVLGTHIMDLMRMLAGDPAWCFGRVLQAGKPVGGRDVRDGAEGIGPLAGDEVHAVYGLARVPWAISRRTVHGMASTAGSV